MDIECLIRRAGGTSVPIGDVIYDFQPDTRYLGAHVAAVEDAAHVGIFLGIREAYRVATDKNVAAAPVAPVALPSQVIDLDMLDLPSGPEAPAGSDAPTMGDDVLPVPDPEGADPGESAQGDGQSPAAPSSITAEAIDAMGHDEMMALFAQREGRKPSSAIKTETLREKLKEIVQQQTTN